MILVEAVHVRSVLRDGHLAGYDPGHVSKVCSTVPDLAPAYSMVV